MDLFYYTLNIS